MVPELAICIPTFNRAEAVTAATRRALQCSEGLPIEVIVSDNASNDDSVVQLKQFDDDKRFTLICGAQNAGWPGNIRRLADATASPYVLLMSDEDDIADREVLVSLLSFLNEHSPGVACAGIGAAGNRFEDGETFFHMTSISSGLVLRSFALQTALRRIDLYEHPEQIEEMWQTYPQVLLALDPWLQGEPFIGFGQRLLEPRVYLPTHDVPATRLAGTLSVLPKHGDLPKGKQHYKHPLARMAQQEGLAVWADYLMEDLKIVRSSPRFKSLQRWQQAYATSRLLKMLEALYPQLYPRLRRGLRNKTSYSQSAITFARKLVAKAQFEASQMHHPRDRSYRSR